MPNGEVHVFEKTDGAQTTKLQISSFKPLVPKYVACYKSRLCRNQHSTKMVACYEWSPFRQLPAKRIAYYESCPCRKLATKSIARYKSFSCRQLATKYVACYKSCPVQTTSDKKCRKLQIVYVQPTSGKICCVFNNSAK